MNWRINLNFQSDHRLLRCTSWLFLSSYSKCAREISKTIYKRWFVSAGSVGKCFWRLNFLKSLNLSCLVALCKVSFLSSRIWNLFLTSCKWYFLKIFEIFRILASFLTLRNDFLFGVYLKLSPILKTSSQYSICCCDVEKFFLPISC